MITRTSARWSGAHSTTTRKSADGPEHTREVDLPASTRFSEIFAFSKLL